LTQASHHRDLTAPLVLEIGCYSGYSALAWYEATKKTNAEIVTLELDPKMIAASKRTINKYKLGDRVHLIEGYAQDSIETLSGQFDIIFVDANKEKLLSPHGLIMCDNGKNVALGAFHTQRLTSGFRSFRPWHDYLHRDSAEQEPGVLDRVRKSAPALLHLLQERPQDRHNPHARVRRRDLHQVEAVSGLTQAAISGGSMTLATRLI
jgi:SAM-dependent methyltransferase